MRRTMDFQGHIKVHLASRDVLTTAGLQQLLKPCGFIRVTGVTYDAKTTVAAVGTASPDVLVVSGCTEQEIKHLITSARQTSKALKVVAVTNEAAASHLAANHPTLLEGILIQGGDFLEDIGAVLRIIHRGGRVVSGHHAPDAGAPSQKPAASNKLASRLLTLSPRATLILHALASGRTNAQIAQSLHVSVATIKADLARIMDLMQATSRVHLAVLAAQAGLLSDDLGSYSRAAPLKVDTSAKSAHIGAGRIVPSESPR